LQPIAITYTCPYYGRQQSDKTDEIFVIMPLAIESCFEFKKKKECTVPMAKRFMVQITSALAYLHAHKLCYRDMKSANVLVFKDETYSDAYNAVLCDLGMCKPLTEGHLNSEHVGTTAYKSPEVMLSPGRYTYSMDIWSLAVFFIEMINIHIPFNRQPDQSGASRMEDNEVLTKIFKRLGSPDMKTWNKLTNGGDTIIGYDRISKWKAKPIADLFDRAEPKVEDFEEVSEGLPNFGTFSEFSDLLQKMLVINPDGRIAASDILNEPFFAQVPQNENSPNRDMWRGLCRPPVIAPKPHVLLKIKDDVKRNKGLEVIDRISIDHDNLGYRIMFLGLDLYDRCLLVLEEKTMKTQSKPNENLEEVPTVEAKNPSAVAAKSPSKEVQTDELDPGLLAYTCCYIACKYFMDETTPDLRILFPKTTCYEDSQIIQMEKTILMELVQWETYRPTVYDILEKKTAPATLFAVLKKKFAVYGHAFTKLVAQFSKYAQ
jgi:serine/threonine protein kinase